VLWATSESVLGSIADLMYWGPVAQPPGHPITRALYVERPDDGSDDADARSHPHWAWVLCVYRGCGSGGLTEMLLFIEIALDHEAWYY